MACDNLDELDAEFCAIGTRRSLLFFQGKLISDLQGNPTPRIGKAHCRHLMQEAEQTAHLHFVGWCVSSDWIDKVGRQFWKMLLHCKIPCVGFIRATSPRRLPNGEGHLLGPTLAVVAGGLRPSSLLFSYDVR